MYYTSSGGGNSRSSGYSGQDNSNQYYGGDTGSGSTTDPSSRMMSGTGMSGREYGQLSKSVYAGAGSWVDSSLASAQRSLQSWKSVGLSGGNAPSFGNDKSSGMDPSAHMTSVRMPVPVTGVARPVGQVRIGGTQTRPRLTTGVQTFQPKGGAQLRGSGAGAASAVRGGPPGPPTSMPPTAGYRNPGQVGGNEFNPRQNPTAQRAVLPAQQPAFGRGTPAPSGRGPTPRASNMVRTSQCLQPPWLSFGAGTRMADSTPQPPQPRPPPSAGTRTTEPIPRTPQPPQPRPSSSAGTRMTDPTPRTPQPPQPRPPSIAGTRMTEPTLRTPQPPQPRPPSIAGTRMTEPTPRTPQPLQPRPPSSAGTRTTEPTPLMQMELTPFQARLQDFSHKSCSDLGISVEHKMESKKHCSLEGFSAKVVETDTSQKAEDDRENDKNDSSDDDDDDDVDMTQCKLCNIKFEKAQVFLLFVFFSVLNVFLTSCAARWPPQYAPAP